MIGILLRGGVYHIDGHSHTLRGTLGTKSRDIALRLSNKIEVALLEGPRSPIWPELRLSLPSRTFARITGFAGVEPKLIATWQELRKLFTLDLQKRVKMGELAQKTMDNYEKTLKIFEMFLMKRNITMLNEISRTIEDEYCNWRIDHAKSPQTISGRPSLYFDRCHLHRVFTFACQRELLEKNPFSAPKRPRLERHNARPFSADEAEQLANTAKQNQAQCELFRSANPWLPFWLLRYTGLRPNDAISLQWREIDFAARTIVHVCHKNHKKVNIPLFPEDELLPALEVEYQRRKPLSNESVLLNLNSGRPFKYWALRDLVVKLGRLAGIPNANPYRLRGTFAVDMYLLTNSVYDVARYLGDTVRMVEQHYLPFVKELQEHGRVKRGGGLRQFVTPGSQQKRSRPYLTEKQSA